MKNDNMIKTWNTLNKLDTTKNIIPINFDIFLFIKDDMILWWINKFKKPVLKFNFAACFARILRFWEINEIQRKNNSH